MKYARQTSSAKSTKRALIASAVCTVLCGLLLFSTSVAWFSADRKSGVNELYSGNLDVVLSYSKTMAEGSWSEVKDTTDDIFNVKVGNESKPMLWEPGAVNVVYFKVENKGSLAAKYDFTVVIDSEVGGTNFKEAPNNQFKLSDYIYGGVKEVNNAFTGETEDAKRNAAIDAVKDDRKTLQQIHTGGPLITGEMAGIPADSTNTIANTTKTFALVLYMPDDAGDVTNYRTPGEGEQRPGVKLKVKLVATQDVGEADSFGDGYDTGAVYTDVTATTPDKLTSAINNAQSGDVIGIGGNNIALTELLSVNKNVTIVGDGSAAIENYPTYVGADKVVTFKNVKFDKTTATNNASSVYGEGFKGTVIFDGCTFGNNNWEAIQITPADDCTIIINNCTFNGYAGAKRFIHIEPATNNALKLNVTITNCTFNNCDLVNYNTNENNQGSVIDLDYFAPDSTVTMGNNDFNLSSVTDYPLHPYFCDAAGQHEIVGDTLLTYLTGAVHTYSVTASGLTE